MRSRWIIPLTATVLGLLTAHLLFADTWQTITSGWKPTRIAATSEGIWAASEGGIFYVDPQTGQAELWNNDQGLFNNNVNVVAVQPGSNDLWVGYANGALDLIDGVRGNIVQRTLEFYHDSRVFAIYDIVLGDNAVFVATDIGVSRLEPILDGDLWVIKETYEVFGEWPQPTRILRMHVSAGNLFIGGDYGVAVASLDANMDIPDSWTLYDTGDEIYAPEGVPDLIVNFIDETNSVIYVGMNKLGMYRFDDPGFYRMDIHHSVYAIEETPNGDIFVAAVRGLGIMSDDGNSWEYFLSDEMKVVDMVWAFDALWFVFDTGHGYIGGIGKYDGESLEFLPQNTPGGNGIYAMKVTPSGDLWVTATGSGIHGAYKWRNGIWSSVTPFDAGWEPFGDEPYAIGVDDRGGIWIGTRGSGLLHILESEDGLATTYFDTSSGQVKGWRTNSDFLMVSGFAREPNAGIWMTNTYAHDNKALVYVPLEWYDDPSVKWLRFGSEDSLLATGIEEIVRDDLGRLWMGAFQTKNPHTVVMYNPSGTPEDRSDDNVLHFPKLSMIFDRANSMVLDKSGLLWLGTPDGLYYINTSRETDDFTTSDFMKVSGALGDEIIALTVDPLDNLWVGTRFGVSMLAPDRFTWAPNRKYSTNDGQYPSPLVDNEISALAFDPASGNVYIGTAQGISVLTTPFRQVSEVLTEVEVRPQPFYVGADPSSKMMLVDESLVKDAKVKIFTPSGRLVRELKFEEVTHGWDGRRNDGDWVDSGVYLIIVTEPGGNSKVGKVAVIRK